MQRLDLISNLHFHTGDHLHRTNGRRWIPNGRYTIRLFNNTELASPFGCLQFHISWRLVASEKPWCCSPCQVMYLPTTLQFWCWQPQMGTVPWLCDSLNCSIYHFLASPPSRIKHKHTCTSTTSSPSHFCLGGRGSGVSKGEKRQFCSLSANSSLLHPSAEEVTHPRCCNSSKWFYVLKYFGRCRGSCFFSKDSPAFCSSVLPNLEQSDCCYMCYTIGAGRVT